MKILTGWPHHVVLFIVTSYFRSSRPHCLRLLQLPTEGIEAFCCLGGCLHAAVVHSVQLQRQLCLGTDLRGQFHCAPESAAHSALENVGRF
jgi:hypothetical protein